MNFLIKAFKQIFSLKIIAFTFFASAAYAELKIDSVYPALGQLGHNLEATVSGQGFDYNTEVTMYLDTTNQRMIIGSVDTPNRAINVTISGNYAFVADYVSGLQVIDISNPSAPQITGSVNTPNYAYCVAVSGFYAYVADSASGLQVIDVSNPANPQIIGSADTPDTARGVAVSGDYAFVADGYSGGLQVIDVSNPANPQIIGSRDTLGSAYGVTVVGLTAYVADGGNGLQVIDISVPSNPQIIGAVGTPGYAYSVSISGSYAYVADGSSGLQVIDVSNPSNPQIIGAVETPDHFTEGVAVSGNYAYVADGQHGLQVIDISNPANPKIIGAVDTPGQAYNVSVSDNYAYVADEYRGLLVIDVSLTPQIFGFVDTPDWAMGVALSGSYAYVADDADGLQVIDVSEPRSPRIIGSVDTPYLAQGVTVSGNYAYVADKASGLQVVNVSNPATPQIVGSVNTPDWAYDVTVSNNYAYVADWDGGLQVIDVSIPTNPRIIGSVDTPSRAFGVAIVGNTAFVADDASGLQVIDTSNPANPQIIGAVDTPGSAYAVDVVGNTAYVADGSSGLQVIDISNLAAPQIIGSVNTPDWAYKVIVAGNYVYVADDESGLQVIDVGDPGSPRIISSMDTPGNAHDLAVSGSYAYIADHDFGLVIVPIPVEVPVDSLNSESSLSLTLPSPIDAGHYTLRVFNNSEGDALAGAVTFLGSDDYQILGEKKAIIVAGYRSPGDSLWDKTLLCVHMAYHSLLTQGYTGENIYFLSPVSIDLDGDGQNDVDAESNLQNLSYAIGTWALSARELLFYMTNHGGSGTFQLNQNQILTAETLDGWLDVVQPTVSERIIVVYDACKSGSFIPLLTPPAGKQRIVITSTTADEYAWFENDGVLSFSYQFWAYLQLNAYLVRAFNAAGNMMENDQTALLDASGNGIPNEKVDDISDIVIGRGRVAASTPPVVGKVSEKQILNGEASASLRASNVVGLNPVTHVWGIVIPPGDRSADDPVIDFPKLHFLDADQDGNYDAVYNGFTSVGTYQVLVYAKDIDDAISMPKEIIVSQTAADSYEDDDTFSKASAILLNDPNSQLHNIHDAGDDDWIKFYGLAGETYSIEAYNLGDNCDAVIELYASDGTTLLDSQDTIGDPNADELLEWSCNQDDIYYAKIKHYEPTVFGDGTEYDLKVYRSIAPLTGFVTGKVTDGVSGQAIADVKIRTDQAASALSIMDGSYVMVHPAGTTTVSAQVAGYDSKSYPAVSVNEGGITTRNIVLVPIQADTDNDGIPDSVEIASFCLNPYDADTDNDILLDGEEDTNYDGIFDPGETNPCDPDTDDDQMPDGWEVQYYLNPLINDASEDADGDGYSNLEEYRGQSDPRDGDSLPILRSMPWIQFLLLFD